ncbi:MAG: radical SAM protein [Myxococcales bacterium]|nr:radical SAM protein [Myxococcales bacterium]
MSAIETKKDRPRLRVAQLVRDTDAEGPGRRFALWVQGCTLRCAGCCNPEMFGERGGELREVAELVGLVASTPHIEGLSLLGGEPLQQPAGAAALLAGVRARGLSTMVYSGYTLAEIEAQAERDAAVRALLEATDLLVDGRYDETQPEPTRRWIGSRNQQMHFLSDRYAPDDPRFVADNQVEIRFENGQLLVNGWPAAADALRDALRAGQRNNR